MDNEFSERLSRLADLTDEELNSLEQEMVAAFDAADTAGDIAQMQFIADGLDQVRAEKASRGAAAEPPAEEAAVPAEPVAASGEDEEAPPPADDEPEAPTPEVPGDGDGAETPDDTEAPADPVDPVDPEPEPEPVDPEVPAVEDVADGATASDTGTETDDTGTADEPTADPPAEDAPEDPEPESPEAIATAPENEEEAVKVTNADVPESNQPTAVAASAPVYAITAGGDIPGVTAGSVLEGMDSVIDAMTRKVNAMRGVSGDGERVIVASLTRDLEEEYGEDRILKRGDPEGNSAKIRKYLAATGGGSDLEAMAAAGWCAPKTPLYDIPGIGSTDTPVADSLASFGVDRGGIIWTEPPSLGTMAAKLATLGVWKNTAADGDPPVWQYVPGVTGGGTPSDTKPCIDIECGIEHSAELIAVPLCLCFDVLTSRANPELIRASTDLVQVGQARFKEQWLMAQMFGAEGVVNHTGAGVHGTMDTPLGVARDFLVTMRLVAAQFRWRNRLSANQSVRLYAPAWLREAIASDLTVQMPGDDTLSVGFSEINGYLSDINVSPVWYIDDVPAGVGDNVTAATSNFDSYLGYATPAEWLMTLPGVFTRLDGGSLDLGVVRTKEDVQKNKFCEFAETFEAVAYMGPTDAANAWAVRGTTPVTIRGGFAPAIGTVPAGGVIIE